MTLGTVEMTWEAVEMTLGATLFIIGFFLLGLNGVLTIEVFVLVDEIGEEEPIVVEIIDTHVGSESNHQATKVGSISFGQQAVELTSYLSGIIILLSIIELKSS